MILNLAALVLLASAFILIWREPRSLWAGISLFGGLVLGIIALALAIVKKPSANTAALTLLVIIATATVVLLLTGVMLVLNGLTVMRRESRSLPNALSLVLGLAILGGLTVTIVSFQEDFDTSFGLVILAFLPFLYLGLGLLAYISYSWLYQWGTRRSRRVPAAIVVLGAGLIRGQVPPLLASRLNKAVQLHTKFAESTSLPDGDPGSPAHPTSRVPAAASASAFASAPVLVVSGGKGRDESRSEAEAMVEYLHVKHGFSDEEIVLEDQSTNTRQNIEFTVALLAEQGIVLTREHPAAVVTNNFHAFRAATLMRRQRLVGYAVGAPTAGYYWPSATLREYIAILRDNLVVTVVAVAACFVPLAFELVSLVVR